MKAITTRYLGQTETRPARIIASDLDGHRLIVAWERDAIVDVTPHTQEQRHHAAALAFRDSMNWTGDLITGAVKNGYVHVFIQPSTAGALLDRIKEVIEGDEHGEIQSCADAVQDIGQILREREP